MKISLVRNLWNFFFFFALQNKWLMTRVKHVSVGTRIFVNHSIFGSVKQIPHRHTCIVAHISKQNFYEILWEVGLMYYQVPSYIMINKTMIYNQNWAIETKIYSLKNKFFFFFNFFKKIFKDYFYYFSLKSICLSHLEGFCLFFGLIFMGPK